MTAAGLHTLSRRLAAMAALSGCLIATACSNPDKNEIPPMDNVSHIDVHKSERRMVIHGDDGDKREFNIGLGSEPLGHKRQEGDGKTPVGTYHIDRKNPQSQFYLSLGISYPNVTDKLVAELMGVDPGGDIFIHGEPNKGKRRPVKDWTEGCIAVTDREISYIYQTVELGTPIHIYD